MACCIPYNSPYNSPYNRPYNSPYSRPHCQPHCRQTIFQRCFFERAVPCTKRGLFVYRMQIFPFPCTKRGLFVHGMQIFSLPCTEQGLFVHGISSCYCSTSLKPHLFRETLQNGNKPPILPHLFRESAVFRNKTLCSNVLPCGKHKPKTFRWLLIFFFGRVKTDNHQQKHIKSELFAAYFCGSRLNVSYLTSPAENPACHSVWSTVIPYGPLLFRFVLSFRAERRNLCEATKESARLMDAIRKGQRAVP